ncbi:hypothetical protein SAMN05443543_107126 [Flavobacterium flevense]|nr:hypothetical protein SAMN05443543_107126 [Flavobacterium flevense]
MCSIVEHLELFLSLCFSIKKICFLENYEKTNLLLPLKNIFKKAIILNNPNKSKALRAIYLNDS